MIAGVPFRSVLLPVLLVEASCVPLGTVDLIQTPPGFEHRFADANGISLHYVRDGGPGSTVILLHGWPQDWYQWHEVMPLLQGEHDVIAVDLRGIGGSSKPDRGYDKATLAADISGLMESQGINEAHIVGHDIGGQTAVSFAYAYPQKTKTLTVIDVPTPGTELFEEISMDPRAWHWRFHANVDLAMLLVSGRQREYFEYFFARFAAGIPGVTEQEINYYAHVYSDPDTLRAGFEFYAAFDEDHARNKELFKTPLELPALAVNSSETVPFPHVTQALSTFARDTEGFTPRPSGHWIPDQHPEQLAEVLKDFFARHP